MYYLSFSDHYIVRVSWINSTAVSAIWMNRSQNLSVVVHCLQQNNWICYEVNFLNIHTSNTYCCRQEIVYILFLLLPCCPTKYFYDVLNHVFTTILLSSIHSYIKKVYILIYEIYHLNDLEKDFMESVNSHKIFIHGKQ